jgi:hypothetical protein
VLSLGGAVLSAASAGAATHTVRVSVIGRDGTAHTAQVSLVDLTGRHRKALRAGRSTAVADGQYAIGAFVHEPGAVTLIARTITVSKNLTVTLDARPGARMTFGVDDPAATLSALEVVPFVGNHPVVTDSDRSIDPHDAMYVVPAAQDTATWSAASAASPRSRRSPRSAPGWPGWT